MSFVWEIFCRSDHTVVNKRRDRQIDKKTGMSGIKHPHHRKTILVDIYFQSLALDGQETVFMMIHVHITMASGRSPRPWTDADNNCDPTEYQCELETDILRHN